MKRLLLLAFVILCGAKAFSQKSFTLEIKAFIGDTSRAKSENELLSRLSYKRSFYTKTERRKEIQNVLFTLYDNAYLSAEIEKEMKDENDSLKEIAFISIGRQYKWAH